MTRSKSEATGRRHAARFLARRGGGCGGGDCGWADWADAGVCGAERAARAADEGLQTASRSVGQGIRPGDRGDPAHDRARRPRLAPVHGGPGVHDGLQAVRAAPLGHGARRQQVDPNHQYLRCDLDDGCSLHPLTEETGATAASVCPDGKYVYYFVDQTTVGGGRLTLKRVNLDGTGRERSW